MNTVLGSGKMLFLGAHPDDIESGAGGLLARMSNEPGKHDCICMVFSTTAEQPGNENILKELKDSMRHAGLPESNLKVLDIPNTRFPENAHKIRRALEEVRDKWAPDIIVTHYLDNTHQDHKCLAEETVRVFRTHTILMYEDLKSTPRFVPNMTIALTDKELDKKVRMMESYKSQFRRHYHDTEYLRSIARMRGKRLGLDWGEAYHIYHMIVRRGND